MQYDDPAAPRDWATAAPGQPRRRRRGMGTAARMGLFLFGALAFLGLAGAVAGVGLYLSLSANLPDPHQLEQMQMIQQSVVYARDGTTQLATFGTENRTVLAFKDIPPKIVDATTAVEDNTFWDNSGFDPVGILASGVDALRGKPRGGSTITQQLVRQRLLTDNGTAQTQTTISRKLKEIIQSIRVTQAYPGVAGKQRIVAAYLNQNYYGNDTYGVAAAIKGYFGIDVTDPAQAAKLTLAQAAIIAALPQAPDYYDLVQNAQPVCTSDPSLDPTDPKCKGTQLVVPQDSPIVQRRNQVLDLMAEDRTPLLTAAGQTPTAADFAAAKQEPVVLASQKAKAWQASQFVYQVRKELATQLCGQGVDTCPVLERGGLNIQTTLDWKLQGIAQKWVKAAAILPHQSNPAAYAKKIGVPYQAWMRNLTNKSLYNGALIAEDYQTGQIIAYVGSADATATKATKKFQPQFDVLADGWRQPGSAFKPVMYATGIAERYFTAASVFMDVATDMGGGYTPTDADMLERGPVRMQDALRFSLNIPAVKALSLVSVPRVQAQAEAMGVNFQNGKVTAGLSFALGVAEVHGIDLVRAYGTLADGGQLADQTTLLKVTDSTNNVLIDHTDISKVQTTKALDPQAAYIITDTLAGNTQPSINPFWGQFELTNARGQHRPATLKTGTNNDAKDLNAWGYIGAPSASDRTKGEYALAVGAWNGNSDNSVVSSAANPIFSIDVTTYVWQGFLQEATKSWSLNAFIKPDGLDQATVDPWTGSLASGKGPQVTQLFLPGTAPTSTLPANTCGDAVLTTVGFEKDNPNWLAADRAWLKRAQKGAFVGGGAKGSSTSYFYNGGFNPYGHSWGPLVNGGGCGSPSPSASVNPCASPLPSDSSQPVGGSGAPGASSVLCPSPSVAPSASASPSESLPAATPTPTPTAPPPTPTPVPTPTPTPVPTPTPAPTPTHTPTAAPTPTPKPS
ncbi:MAG: transglycosylase domain-containing protein [Candidatus Limnocylindrales bacterium]